MVVRLRTVILSILAAAPALAVCTVDASGWPDGEVVRTAVAQLKTALCAEDARVSLTRGAVGPEGYRLSRDGMRYTAAAADPRGLLYGAYALADALSHNSFQPGEFVPRFAYREWWSA